MKPKRIQRRERPILFSGPMVRAILAGRKTQTRRVVRWKGRTPPTAAEFCGLTDSLGYPASEGFIWAGFGNRRDPLYWRCPYGRPGDRLWVRETWGIDPNDMAIDLPDRANRIVYRADDSEDRPYHWGWHSPIYMPRWASRLTLEVTAVRVEQVQEITEADAKAEGCDGGKNVFQDLWEALNRKRGFGWDVNPWVWVVCFKRLEVANG